MGGFSSIDRVISLVLIHMSFSMTHLILVPCVLVLVSKGSFEEERLHLVYHSTVRKLRQGPRQLISPCPQSRAERNEFTFGTYRLLLLKLAFITLIRFKAQPREWWCLL